MKKPQITQTQRSNLQDKKEFPTQQYKEQSKDQDWTPRPVDAQEEADEDLSNYLYLIEKGLAKIPG